MPKQSKTKASPHPRQSLNHIAFSKRSLIVFILIFATIGSYVIYRGFAANPPAFTANLYVVPSGSSQGSASCVRSTILVDYPTALANNNVCKEGSGNAGSASATSLTNACYASRSGSGDTVIGMKAGTYTRDLVDGALMQPGDGSTVGSCANSSAGDFNPNCDLDGRPCGSLANWTTVKCADGETQDTVLTEQDGGIFMWGNFHVRFNGACFNFYLRVGAGGSSSAVHSRNLVFEGLGNSPNQLMHIFSYDIAGGENIMIKNASVGPSAVCGKIDPNTPTAWQCNTSMPFWESRYANYGTSQTSCSTSGLCGGTSDPGKVTSTGLEPYLHYGDSSDMLGVRIQNVYTHDQADRNTNITMGHPGCILVEDSSMSTFGLVIDHLVCERVAVQGIQGDVNGMVVQNSVFGCPVDIFRDTGTAWDHCNQSNTAISLGGQFEPSGFKISNNLIRYNVFLGDSVLQLNQSPQFGFSNNRIIGNIFLLGNTAGESVTGGLSGCGQTGIFADYNVFQSGLSTCGSNATTISGNPFVQADEHTSDHLWRDSSQLDAHPSGSITIPTVPNLGSDYNLATDADGNTRTYPTLAGAYISNTSSSAPTVSISAAPTTINSGQSSTLTWSSTNATSCSASGAWSGNLATSGSQSTGALASTSIYSLACTGPNGSASASVTVTVSSGTGPPTITSFSPTSGPIGTVVTITGTNLDQTTTLQFNQGEVVSYTINSSTQITATVPPGTSSGNISINLGQATSAQTFTVTSDTTPPSAPTNLTKTGSSSTSITVSWTASTDNVGVTGYDLYKNGNSTGTTASTSSTFSGLACGTSYPLAVDAFDAVGNKSGQASISASTSACADTTPPTVSITAPVNGTTVSGASVSITATAADNVGVAGVQFQLDGNNQGAEDTTSPYSTVWDTTTLGNGTHTLTATARDAAGNTTTSTAITVTVNNVTPPPPDTTPPSVPTGLAKTSSTTSSISLSWNASSDNSGGSGLSGYRIYRNGSLLSSIGLSLSYTDNNLGTGLSPATSYAYQVSAYDNATPTANESAKSTTLNVSTDSLPVTPPPSPPPSGTPPPAVKGDCNGDGHVTIIDLSILLSHYGTNYPAADFDGSSIVNIIDLSILLSNYGR
jgi:chitodextrinase